MRIRCTIEMALFVHLAPENDSDSIRRTGIKPRRIRDGALDGKPSPVVLMRGNRREIVRAAALSGNGARLVTAYANRKTACVWNLEAAEPSSTLIELRGVKAIAQSRDGKRLVTEEVGRERAVRVWDLAADDPSASSIVLKKGKITSFALSQDGTRLATGSADKTARVWDLEADDPSTAPIARRQHKEFITSLALSRDGTRMVTMTNDHTVRVWDLDDADTDASLIAPKIAAFALSQNGKRLATVSYDRKTARVWTLD